MTKLKTRLPLPDKRTGLAPSPAQANRLAQAASALAIEPGETLTTNQALRISDI